MRPLYSLSSLLVLLLCLSCNDRKPAAEKDPLPAGELLGDAANIEGGEFTLYSNGLIYDKPTMGRLNHLVDSLHLRFKRCEPKTYYALPQGPATVVFLSKGRKKARMAMENNISLADFKKQFPSATIQSGHWMVKERYRNSDGEEKLCYSSSHAEEPFSEYCAATADLDKSQGWIVFDDDDGFRAFYLEGFTTPAFPARYGALLQYVDCMVDTTATIFTGDRNKEPVWELPEGSSLQAFFSLVDDYHGAPKEPKSIVDGVRRYDSAYSAAWDTYSNEYHSTRAIRIATLDKRMRDRANITLLLAANEEAIVLNFQSDDLEFYAERYLSAVQALRLKRSYVVVGNCSMDSRPREHAQQICRLAAKAGQWDIFLRAHLDIMNDNFERMSDGSYAYARRQTYFQELEALEINATDLLIGSCLLASNTNRNHYTSDWSRAGRALAESKDRAAISQRLLAMASDPALDLHNRVAMTWLLFSLSKNLQTTSLVPQTNVDFFKAINQLPMNLRRSFRHVTGMQ